MNPRDHVAEELSARAWLTNAILCALGVGLLLMAKQFVSESDHFTIGFSGVSGWSAWMYVASVVVIVTQPSNRATLWIVLGFAVAFRMMTLFAEPFLSSDIYRYVWDGIVQHAHVNPYRYVPGDAALAYLRKPNQDVFDMINRRDYARTIYPPVAQVVYWSVTFFSPTVQAMKVAMFGFECLTVAALMAMLRWMQRPAVEVLLYAWCPLLVWEIGGSGHLDAAVFCFATLAVLFRWREKPVFTGLFLGLAVMTKFYPLVLFPALYKRGDWKMPATLAAVVVAGYTAYSSVGRLVFGFLGGYSKEEGLDTGTRYFLLELVQRVKGLEHLPVSVYMVFCAAVLGGISWWCWKHATVEARAKAPFKSGRNGGLKPASNPGVVASGVIASGDLASADSMSAGATPRFVQGAMMLGFAMMLLFSPHYPWYIVWLIPMFALTRNLPLLTYLMVVFYMFTTPLADGQPGTMFELNKILYGAVALSAVIYVLLRRWGWWRSFEGLA